MSQVDHVTSHRPSDPLITSAEPAPAKALVIEDLGGDLPTAFLSDKLQAKYGVVVRSPRAKATRSQRGARRRRRACHCPLRPDADGHPRPWARRRCRPDAVPGSPRHYPDPPRCRGVQGGGRVHGVGGLADANRVWSVDILHHSERGGKGGNPPRPDGPKFAPAGTGSGGIDGAGAGNDSRVPGAGSRGRRGRGLSGLTKSLRSDRRGRRGPCLRRLIAVQFTSLCQIAW